MIATCCLLNFIELKLILEHFSKTLAKEPYMHTQMLYVGMHVEVYIYTHTHTYTLNY